jgi:hypothetical protein
MSEKMQWSENFIKAINDNPELLKKINSTEFKEFSKNKNKAEVKARTIKLLKEFREERPMVSLTDWVKKYYKEVVKFSRENIFDLQTALNKNWSNIQDDSHFWNETFLAIVDFQIKNWLVADWKAWSDTLKKLGLWTVDSFYKNKTNNWDKSNIKSISSSKKDDSETSTIESKKDKWSKKNEVKKEIESNEKNEKLKALISKIENENIRYKNLSNFEKSILEDPISEDAYYSYLFEFIRLKPTNNLQIAKSLLIENIKIFHMKN